MKWFKRIALLLLVFIGIVFYVNHKKLTMISGYAAKYMVSSVLIANHSPDSVKAIDLDAPLIKLADVTYHHSKKEATANVYGLQNRKAIFRTGLGGALVPDDFKSSKTYLKPKRNQHFDSIAYPYGHLPPKDSTFKEIDYDQLSMAMAQVFSNPEIQKTRTALVLYKGHLIAEHYADGFNANTPILGWSMTKSLLATCFGILEHQGKIEVNWPAPITEWKDDARKNITLNHLLRMQSGLAWEEDYTKISDVTQMLFLDNDMTIAQKNKEAIAKPGEIWNYSSGTTNLLSGILRQQFRNYQDYLDFPYAEFLDKIGAHSFLIETDLAGNFVGSSYGWASTRDWARVGQLYLDNGVWNGEELFDKNWITYITTPTAKSNGTYGGQFWLNSKGDYPDVPKDLYSMNGYQGQHVYIIPSKNLVIVRTGLAERPDYDANAFLSMVVAAVVE